MTDQTPQSGVPLGERLRGLREGKGLSQADLARAMHLTRQTISGWECGRSQPDLAGARQLAAIYEVSLDELLSGVESPAKRPSRWRWLFLGAAVLLLVLALLETGPASLMRPISSLGIIGGADGPTAIFVTHPPYVYFLSLLPLLSLAATFFCIFLMLRWRGSHSRRHYRAIGWAMLALAGLYLAAQTIGLLLWGLAGSAGGWATWANSLLNPGFWAPLGLGAYALYRYGKRPGAQQQ